MRLQKPYSNDWQKGYLQTNSENRKTVILYNSPTRRSSTSYARYLMSVHLGRYLTDEEEVDHIDNDKTNDNLENLQILSKKENMKKEGLRRRSNLKHGSLNAYRHCKCHICRKGKSLYSSKRITEYRQWVDQNNPTL